MPRLILVSLLLAAFAVTAGPQHPPGLPWQIQNQDTDTNLRGVSVVRNSNEKRFAVWASGSNGTILLSLDEGKSWKHLAIPGAEKLDFRGIAARGSRIAYAMSSGEGAASRIYRTTDGGANWQQQYIGDRKEVFLDALTCSADDVCLALGDPVDGKFLLLYTHDGSHWKELPRGNMPSATAGEGAFAASGSCLFFSSDSLGGTYFATGGGPAPRVFHADSFTDGWRVSETPLARGNASSGVFSFASSGSAVVIVGGDYQNPANSDRVAAYSLDEGVTWRLAEQQPGGYRSGVAHIHGSTFVTVGTSGEDVSFDNGKHWQPAGQLNLNAVTATDAAHIWAVGARGLIARSATAGH